MSAIRGNKDLRLPGHFLIGAPRCGTTSMSRALRAHPQVCFSDPKETHFFSYVWRQRPPQDLRSEYLERYFGAYDASRHRVLCDGSVSYLYDRRALERILELQPEARFVVMVRDPFEMLPSYHQRLLYLLEEDVASFAEAWRLQGRRARGEALPARCTHPDVLRYAEIGRLGAHVSALLGLAGGERCHVVVHDDLRSDPAKVYLGVLDFLGVEDDGCREFPHRLRSKHYRSRLLQRLLFKPPGAIMKVMAPAAAEVPINSLSAVRPWLKRARKYLMRRNRREVPPPVPTPEMQELLRRELAEDVALLGALLGRDLGHWLGGDPRTAPDARGSGRSSSSGAVRGSPGIELDGVRS
jgi:hypothetical protein